MKKYTLSIPDLTMEKARKIADDIFGSMMWGAGENGETLVCYPDRNPVTICEQIPATHCPQCKSGAEVVTHGNIRHCLDCGIKWPSVANAIVLAPAGEKTPTTKTDA